MEESRSFSGRRGKPSARFLGGTPVRRGLGEAAGQCFSALPAEYGACPRSQKGLPFRIKKFLLKFTAKVLKVLEIGDILIYVK